MAVLGEPSCALRRLIHFGLPPAITFVLFSEHGALFKLTVSVFCYSFRRSFRQRRRVGLEAV
jgi:hypothetical protein